MTSGATQQRRVALDHALDVRRGGVGLRRPPLLRVPVEAAARDRAHGVDHVGPVGEREDDVRVAVAVGAELDVVSGLHETHGTVHGSAPVGCPAMWLASVDGADHPVRTRRGSRSPTRGCCAATAASRCCASTAAAVRLATTTLARLGRTCAGLRLEATSTRCATEALALLERAGEPESLLRLVVTRGGRRIAIVEPLPARAADGARRHRHLRADPRAQRAQDAVLRGNMLAGRLAKEQGADEALLVTPHGRVLEGPTWTFFWVAGGGSTPPLQDGILDSITRARLLEELRRDRGRRARSTTCAPPRRRSSRRRCAR